MRCSREKKKKTLGGKGSFRPFGDSDDKKGRGAWVRNGVQLGKEERENGFHVLRPGEGKDAKKRFPSPEGEKRVATKGKKKSSEKCPSSQGGGKTAVHPPP